MNCPNPTHELLSPVQTPSTTHVNKIEVAIGDEEALKMRNSREYKSKSMGLSAECRDSRFATECVFVCVDIFALA